MRQKNTCRRQCFNTRTPRGTTNSNTLYIGKGFQYTRPIGARPGETIAWLLLPCVSTHTWIPNVTKGTWCQETDFSCFNTRASKRRDSNRKEELKLEFQFTRPIMNGARQAIANPTANVISTPAPLEVTSLTWEIISIRYFNSRPKGATDNMQSYQHSSFNSRPGGGDHLQLFTDVPQFQYTSPLHGDDE